MKLFILIWIAAIATRKCVLSLGEDGNFNELVEMVVGNITASMNYQIPDDNSDVLNLTDRRIRNGGTFDFIVVGAGAAGAVISNRLTENREWSVLLLEAGGEANDFTKIPGMGPYTWNSELSWGFKTVPQKNACLGYRNQQCVLPQGRVIGGSTSINAAFYVRGHPEDYNRLESVYGNPGWRYHDVLPYFMKSENAGFSPRDTCYHGEDGYFTVNQTNEVPGVESIFKNGFNELGIVNSIDYNGQVPNGISKLQAALKGNERVSSATAFLNNFRNRTNLNIRLKSFVTKILINRNNQAYGVRFIRNGKTYEATARKEVIVSAGAINSPQILMLSGIGPRQHLSEVEIPVKRDLPVGKNLQDHLMFISFYFRVNHTLYSQDLVDLLKLYVEHKRPLTVAAGAQLMAFMNPGKNQYERADIEYIVHIPGVTGDLLKVVLGLNDEYAAAYKSNISTDICLNVILLHPESRGTVKLKSNNPIDKPIIDPNYLDEPEDIEKIYEAIQFLIGLNNTQAFKDNGIQMVVFDHPGCENLGKLTKKWWICAIKHITTTVFHPVSTNRMGPNPRTAVVNSRLKVHGIKRLRVADASILPEVTSGHTMAPSMMIGEKAADMIKEDWRQ